LIDEAAARPEKIFPVYRGFLVSIRQIRTINNYTCQGLNHMSASRFMLRPLTRALLMHGASRSRLATTGLGLAMTMAVTPYVQAQEWTLNIPAQPLAQALQSLGQQTSLQIIYSPESLQGLRSTALSGRYADDSAIAAMLKGTGIRHQRDGNTVTLLAPATGSAMELAPTNINGQRLTETTEGSNSYTTGGVTIGKGVHSLKETPQSVTVMTRKMLDDQNLNTIEQVMEKTPGPQHHRTSDGKDPGHHRLRFAHGRQVFLLPRFPHERPVPVRRRAAGHRQQLRTGRQLQQRHGHL